MKDKVKIHVLPKVEFEEILNNNDINDDNVEELINYAFISINDSCGNYYHKPLFKSEHHNVLTLFFDDVSHDMEGSPTNRGETKAFTREQASEIISFLKENKNVNTVLVHCAAGISRSGAVGQFVLDFMDGDRDFFQSTNRHIMPNVHISRTLNEEMRNGNNPNV